MRLAKWISAFGVIAMTAVIGWAFVAGDFFADGSLILANPWGVVSLVDLYVGFIIFSMWIAFREEKIWVAAIWILLMMTLGFFTGALYVFLNLHKHHNDWEGFFMGARS